MMRIPTWLISALLLVAFVGFMDAVYLSVHALQGLPPPCFITAGCDTVTTSQYSHIFGVPIAILGALYYLVILAKLLWYVDKKDERVMKLLPWITSTGFLVSCFLVYLQFFVIHALCIYCLTSATTSTLLFLLALATTRYKAIPVNTI